MIFRGSAPFCDEPRVEHPATAEYVWRGHVGNGEWMVTSPRVDCDECRRCWHRDVEYLPACLACDDIATVEIAGAPVCEACAETEWIQLIEMLADQRAGREAA